MPIIYTPNQKKTIENLAGLCASLLGESLTVSVEKPDPKGRTVELLLESESSTIKTKIGSDGMLQSVETWIDGKPSKPNVDLSALFGFVARCWKPKKAN